MAKLGKCGQCMHACVCVCVLCYIFLVFSRTVRQCASGVRVDCLIHVDSRTLLLEGNFSCIKNVTL
jgi:hypothetical protein